jgi:Rod binding domain-containing protein
MNAILNQIGAMAPDPADKEAKKQLAAAKDFEAILIGQMLHSVREEGSGWLGTGDDDVSATAFGFGEDQLAKALTKGGGLGLSKVIAAGLAAKTASAEGGAGTRAQCHLVFLPSPDREPIASTPHLAGI